MISVSSRALLPFAAAAFTLCSSVSAQSTWQSLPGTTPEGVSGDGSVVTGSAGSQYFRWTAGDGVVLIGGTPAGNGVGGRPTPSDDGARIAGTRLNPVSGLYEISLYEHASATWTSLGGLGGVSGGSTSSGWGISRDGLTLVGLGWISAGAHAISWTAGTGIVDLGSTVPNRSTRANGTNADGSVVYGWQDAASGFRQGAFWSGGVQTLITAAGTGAMLGEVSDCSDDGTVMVGLGVNANGDQPYRWTAATGGVSLGLLPGIFSPRGGATAVTADGATVIGFVRPFSSPATFGQGFLWREDLGIVSLTDYLAALGVPLPADTVFALPLDMSADGSTMVGLSRTGNSSSGVAVTGIPAPSTIFCDGQMNSAGCVSEITVEGVASITSGQPFLLRGQSILAATNGLLIYSTSGAASTPFNGGTLCLTPPIQRTPIQSSGGATGCDGSFSFDFNGLIALGGDPALGLGAQVWAQYWSRDPNTAGGTNLTNAVHFYVVP